MNKYLISFADVDNNLTWIEAISARNIAQAQAKLISLKCKEWELDEDFSDLEYSEFVDKLFDEGILVGDIVDIESF